MKETQRAKNRFYYIKKLIDASNDVKDYIDGFYYNKKAIDYINRYIDKNYFLNQYYNLTTSDFLTMIDDAKNLKQVKANLFNDYKDFYASAIYDAFIDGLGASKSLWKKYHIFFIS